MCIGFGDLLLRSHWMHSVSTFLGAGMELQVAPLQVKYFWYISVISFAQCHILSPQTDVATTLILHHCQAATTSIHILFSSFYIDPLTLQYCRVWGTDHIVQCMHDIVTYVNEHDCRWVLDWWLDFLYSVWDNAWCFTITHTRTCTHACTHTQLCRMT